MVLVIAEMLYHNKVVKVMAMAMVSETPTYGIVECKPFQYWASSQQGALGYVPSHASAVPSLLYMQ